MTSSFELDSRTRVTAPASAFPIPALLVNRNAIGARLACALPSS